MVAASLTAEAKIGIDYVAAGRRVLGRDGFPALRLADSYRWLNRDQSGPGADGAVPHQLAEAIAGKLSRPGQLGHLVCVSGLRQIVNIRASSRTTDRRCAGGRDRRRR